MKRLDAKPIGRWRINVDLEGFGHFYDKEDLDLLSLDALPADREKLRPMKSTLRYRRERGQNGNR